MTDITPSGCRWCGIPERGHARQWMTDVGWHTWERPGDGLILARMIRRRLAHNAAAALKGTR